jgi:hypothetical protein
VSELHVPLSPPSLTVVDARNLLGRPGEQIEFTALRRLGWAWGLL